jgi:2-C-methyl-D-erythritol 2,4-cyclodiphosphate synthase
MVRIGLGFDAHRFSNNRKLVLGGVNLDYKLGLEGHSDADVLLHALCDALLGAAALGDIGTHFPETDPTWKNVPSRLFVEQSLEMVRQKGWRIVNADLTVIAQVPKMQPHRDAIRKSVAEILKIETEAISVKATTTDFMGFTGREEGIAAVAIVLLDNDRSS